MDSNFPLKVICPKCCAAVGAKCTEKAFSLGSSTRFVDWFHFERIEKANEIDSYHNLPVSQLPPHNQD